jgi:hypothetical protein
MPNLPQAPAGAGMGTYKNIIPVIMHANTPIEKPQASPPEPDIGSRWGTTSQFQVSQNTDPTSAANGDPSPPPSYVKDSPKEETKIRVESYSSVKIQFDGYETPFHGCDQVTCSDGFSDNEVIAVVWLSLGKETQKEVAGFTAYADGHVVERYKDFIWDRYVRLDCSTFPAVNRVGGSRIEGGIPPP